MRRLILAAAAVLAAICGWWILVLFAVSEGWLKTPITTERSPAAFLAAAKQQIAAGHVGNLSMILVEDGQVAARHDVSSGRPVDGASVFQVASLGKWLTAWGVMTLVEDNALDLDAPVAAYLDRWQLPASEFDVSAVTVRRLLSHTAGLDDGLGYQGFRTPAERQSLEESLARALQDFTEFMTARVFQPLGMRRTTFDHAEAVQLGLAENFGPGGQVEEFRWYTALGATSLFTSAEDLAVFLQAQAPGRDQPVLSAETLALMRTPHAEKLGAAIWGLGVMLYAPNGEDGFIIGHDGSNEPAINSAARLDPQSGDGIVVLEMGTELLASQLAGEWVFWKTGRVDNLAFVMEGGRIRLWGSVGTLVILMLGWWGYRQR